MARSADEGLGLARQTRPDLVIADVPMPGRSGYDLCAAIKADAGLRPIPVFILASTQQPYDEAKGQQVGADGHLVKPWESATLIDKVREVIGRGASAVGPGPASGSGLGSGRPAPASPPLGAFGRSTASSLPAVALADEYGSDIDMDASRDTSARHTAPAMPATAPAHVAPVHAPAPAHAPPPAPPPRAPLFGTPATVAH